MRILVTGGAGFIGSNLVYELNKRGYTDISIVDRLGTSNKWRNLIGLQFIHYTELDSFKSGLHDFENIVKNFDIIFHLGACSSTREIDASYLLKNNYEFSCKLLDYANAFGIRFIYASSAATYGLGNMSDNLTPEACRPINPYGLSKNIFDQFVKNVGLYDKVAGLKYFNIFGPNSAHKGIMMDFVAKCVEQITTKGYIEMYDTHIQSHSIDGRDFLYVKDAVDMTLHFAFDENGRKSNGLFNIGSGKSTSWFEIAQKVAQKYNCSDIRFKEMPDSLKDKYQYFTNADITKLRSSGYKNKLHTIDEAIEDYIDNYLKNDKRRGE